MTVTTSPNGVIMTPMSAMALMSFHSLLKYSNDWSYIASIFLFCHLTSQVHTGGPFSDPIFPSWFLPLMIYFKVYITLEPTNKWSYDAKKSTHSNDVFGPVDASVSEGMRKWCCYICLCVWNHQSQCCWGTWRKEAYIPGISYESNKYYKSWRYQHRPISMLVAAGEYQI